MKNETNKTIAFLGVAVAVLLIAWASRPSLPTRSADDQRGQRLFPEFNDPLAAASLEIVDYDEATGNVRRFEVALNKNVWSIPSHENYPADAKDQMARAARDVMDLKILGVEGDAPGAHADYGVVDPDPKTLKAGATGVGTRVVMKDGGKKDLLALIIGKAVPNKSELRYVRRVGQDAVYVTKVSTSSLSAKFEDWIEKNLLKMDSFDFQKARINDYSVDALRGRLVPRGEMLLAYDDSATDQKWKLVEGRKIDKGIESPIKLAADEELNATKLDDLKRSLDDLKIIDVKRKPKGLSADLKASGDFSNNQEAVQSLAERGFYVANVGNQVGLFSNEGEVRATMKTGVEYVLRFGNIAMDADTGPAKKDDKDGKKDDKDKKDEKKSAGRNRYIFVTAEFNPNVLAKPQLEAMPEEKKADDKKDAGKKDDKKAEAKKDEKADAKKAAKPEAKKDEKKDAKPEAKKDDKADAKKDEKKDEAPKPDLKAERERIEKENKRKQEEYDGKVKTGKDKVNELNARFADWYYIISDDVYQKIHLARADVVKKKEKKDDKDKDGKKADEHAGHDHEHDHGPAATPGDFEKLKESAPGKKD